MVLYYLTVAHFFSISFHCVIYGFGWKLLCSDSFFKASCGNLKELAKPAGLWWRARAAPDSPLWFNEAREHGQGAWTCVWDHFGFMCLYFSVKTWVKRRIRVIIRRKRLWLRRKNSSENNRLVTLFLWRITFWCLSPQSVDFKVFLIVHTVYLMITSFNCQMGTTRQYRNVKFFTSSDILVENLVKYITCQGNSLVLFLSCLNLEVQSDVAVLTSSSCPDCSSFISFSSTASAKLSPQLKHHQKTNMYAVSF